MLLAYGQEHAPHTRTARTIAHNIANLAKFWSGKRVSDITARNCRAYAADRPAVAARRDLETLRAALGYWHKEYGPLASVPAVVMPGKPEPRDRWLTRAEAAKLLWAARRMPHLRRFILLGLYTGSRSGVLLSLQWDWIDLDRRIMRRRALGEADSTKRRPPVRLGSRIIAHLRRWKRLDQGLVKHVIHYDGQPVTKLRRSWGTALARSGLEGKISPHTLRHTRATWMMQEGVDPWQAAGHLGMSVQMLQRVYGKHHPDYQTEAAEV